MLWLQILVIGSTAMLFAAALVLSLSRPATSAAPPTDRRKLLSALALLAVGAVFWMVTEVDMPSTLDNQSAWPLSILLGLLAVLVAARPRTGRLVVLVTAVAAPVLAIVGMALIYTVGSGVSDGEGATESFATMALVAVVGTAGAYTAPAMVTAALLRPGAASATVISDESGATGTRVAPPTLSVPARSAQNGLNSTR